jgi:hypothetical protein
MYVQYKNYFLGKTTHERFSKRAALAQPSDKAIPSTEDSTSLRKVAGESNPDSTAEQLLPNQNENIGSGKKQKRGCCFNCKRMMYHKERPS